MVAEQDSCGAQVNHRTRHCAGLPSSSLPALYSSPSLVQSSKGSLVTPTRLAGCQAGRLMESRIVDYTTRQHYSRTTALQHNSTTALQHNTTALYFVARVQTVAVAGGASPEGASPPHPLNPQPISSSLPPSLTTWSPQAARPLSAGHLSAVSLFVVAVAVAVVGVADWCSKGCSKGCSQGELQGPVRG